MDVNSDVKLNLTLIVALYFFNEKLTFTIFAFKQMLRLSNLTLIFVVYLSNDINFG